ncbi:uncharacterized protein LOC119693864 [Plutella xylostella]|uniref:uncharacterized protein LOC119693864 n=1 Tax=Plutella xylostella TaxID=51655 RepID=UPI0020326A8B|nr:uncharacterized protein LOC119693864 [Plutella xylostella]
MWSHVVVSLLLAAAAGAAPAGAGAGSGAEPYNSTAVSRCTESSGAALPLHVLVAGCAAPPCRLPQLQHAELDIVFQAPRYVETMETVATAYFLGQSTEYPLGPDAATCAGLLNSYCPVLRGEVLRYKLRLFIERFMFVGVRADIEFKVREAGGEDLFCFRTGIQVVRPQP